MSIKDAVMIAVITVCFICGALSGVVGGAMGISAVAVALHQIADVK